MGCRLKEGGGDRDTSREGEARVHGKRHRGWDHICWWGKSWCRKEKVIIKRLLIKQAHFFYLKPLDMFTEISEIVFVPGLLGRGGNAPG